MELTKEVLQNLYVGEKKSSAEIATLLHYSEHKINYWLAKHQITKRSISEAIYHKHNPNGDPFDLKKPVNLYEAELYGMGLGLYWGEGTKANKYSVRLGNTDPLLIKKFIEFLEIICGINRRKLRFGLQIFNDIEPHSALRYWMDKLEIFESQFQKVIITPARGVGTYHHKNQYGVITVQFHNKKLRDAICQCIENLK